MIDDNTLNQQQINALVTCVASGRQAKLPHTDIRRQLEGLGVEPSQSAQLLAFVTNALQQGVSAGVTEGMAKPDTPRGQSKLFDAAFDMGLQSYKSALRSELLPRNLVIGLVVIVIAVVIYFIAR